MIDPTLIQYLTTNTRESTEVAETAFSEEQARSLETLRIRFQEDHDFFGPLERAHLRFLRWLVRTERLDPSASRQPHDDGV
jgi:hypothetical protein